MNNDSKEEKKIFITEFNRSIRDGEQPVYVTDNEQTRLELLKANVTKVYDLKQLSEAIWSDDNNSLPKTREVRASDNPVIFLIRNKDDNAENLINRLRESNITVYYQDANKRYSPVMESAKVKSCITEQYSQNFSTWKKADTFRERLRNGKKAIPTGFESLDNILGGGLREGIYTVGAETSVGKTTFCLNIAEQIARQGQDVIIIALEMSTDEMIARSISRLTYQLNNTGDKRKPKTALNILNVPEYNSYPDKDINLINRAFEEYEKFSGHLFISESVADTTTEGVNKLIQNHIDATGNKPVVIVDYLQLLKTESEYINSNEKSKTDRNVLRLKNIARDYGIPIIIVSSFNRSSYQSEKPSLSAFKESGAIEYSSDVCIQLISDTPSQTDESRIIKACILKNRNGKKDVSTKFEYHTMFNHFEEI